MKCPNCGADMPEHSLYCEQCGEDIHIVPDFETVVEDDIQRTIQGIVEEISFDNIEVDSTKQEVMQTSPEHEKDRKKRLIIFCCWGCAVIAMLGAGLYLAARLNSSDYRIFKAKQYTDKGQYEDSIIYYEKLVESEPENISLKFSLAEVYFLENKKEEYESVLLDIIHSPNATIEELNGAYGKLIAIYRAKEDYKTIHLLLMESGNETIISTYNDYIAKAPEFSVPEGYYNEVMPLKMSSAGDGTIYYTINGKNPDDTCTQYIAPLVLDEGDYTIKAIYVNKLGIISDMTTMEYHIKNIQLPEPEISVMSGIYKFPIDIEVLEADEEEIYYTTDGSTPTVNSIMYTGPIHMPIGKSVFQFVNISEGRMGEVALREYSLEMDTNYLPEDAKRDVLQYALNSGKIYDESGHAYNTDNTYIYEYQYVTNINDAGYFYVISEVVRDTEGIMTKTGNHFALNAYTGEMYKLQLDELNNYLLVEIES